VDVDTAALLRAILLFTAPFLACRPTLAPPVQQTIETNGGIRAISLPDSQPGCGFAERDRPTDRRPKRPAH